MTSPAAAARALPPSTRTLGVWVLFVVVHTWITHLGTTRMTGSFQDVALYAQWVGTGLATGTWPVLDGPWVYPVGALLPMLGAELGASWVGASYVLAWCTLVTLLDALAVAALLQARRGRLAATWWLLFVLLLGPVAVGRVDAVVAPLSVVALLVVLRHPRTATALLTLAAWIKVAPGAAVLPVLMTARRPWRDVVLPGALVCAGVVGAVAALGGGSHVLSFVQTQERRGLQVEAVAASPWMVAGLFTDAVGRPLNVELVTYEVDAPGAQATADVLGAALVLAVLAVTALLWWCRRRAGERLWTDDALRHDLVLRGTLALALVLIVTNKVGSPQFIGWLAPPVAAALAVGAPRWRPTAVTLLGVAAATQWVFPWWYDDVLLGVPLATLVLVARNVLLVALLVVTLRHLVRRPDPAPRETGTPGRSPAAGEGSTAEGSGAVRGEPGQQVGTGAAVVDGGVG